METPIALYLCFHCIVHLYSYLCARVLEKFAVLPYRCIKTLCDYITTEVVIKSASYRSVYTAYCKCVPNFRCMSASLISDNTDKK